MLSAPDVVGPGEARELLEMSRPTFSRHKIRADFPPAAHLECGDVYERRAIVAYGKQRTTHVPYLEALELWRDQWSPQRIADHLTTLHQPNRPYSPARVRGWMRQLGEPTR